MRPVSGSSSSASKPTSLRRESRPDEEIARFRITTLQHVIGERDAIDYWIARQLDRSLRLAPDETTVRECSSNGGYFFAALTGSLTFSTVVNSMFQSSPFTLSTLRI